MDNKRVLLAFVLSFAVLIAFRVAFPPATEQPAAPPAAATPAVATPQAVTPPAKAAKLPEVPGSPELHAERAESTVIENDLYKATVYSEGGVLQSFQLKTYPDASGHPPLELINGGSAKAVGWPLAIATGDSKLDSLLSHGNYVVRSEVNKLTMDFASEGVQVRKIIEFDSDNYQFTLSTAVARNGQPVPHQVVWQAGFGDQSIPDDPKKKNAVYDANAKFSRVVLSGIKEPQNITASLVGAEDQYFMTMFQLPTPGAAKIQETEFNAADGTGSRALHLEVPGGGTLRVYVGPKEKDKLLKADPRLVEILDYGWFGFISKPVILPVLNWIHKHVGNYGWAIVLITVLVNLVLFPLRLKSQISMQKMQKIQPQINTLQDKYKKLKSNDPRRAEIQAEIMKLYQEHGSPLGGCLPLLLQMPVMLAFYKMLSVAIELRQAPWILWIHDLSRPDPYYIIPILMAVAMVIGQKMTPTSVDPAQAKMMMIMPILMTAFFLWVQAGLTLYWLTSNLVGIGQQWFIRKYWAEPAQPPRRRANKNKSLPGD
ncbi:MAG TPA: membrane protein insertase YidC [Terriglobia bacterium]|nr:membrane protein insertase YidC [Terriglobia bacterium]